MGRTSTTLYVIVFVFLHLLDLALSSKTLKRDMKALNEIKASLGWRVVYSWVGDDPCGDGDLKPWSGVTCATVGDYRVVTGLEVYAVSIVGQFPTAVTNLLDLTRLDLHNNKLAGPIPPQIGRLRRLKILNLRWNKLQDALPPEIGELKSLTHLYLSFNSFKGEIPKELASLPELRYLYLHENRFSGRIPAELGTLQNLRHLDVGSNHLVGTIRELIRIEGCFPSLRNLYLNNNYLTGGVPAQLANLTNLEILHLSYNKMAGIIPAGLAQIPKLTYFDVDLTMLVCVPLPKSLCPACLQEVHHAQFPFLLCKNFPFGESVVKCIDASTLRIFFSICILSNPQLHSRYLDHNHFTGRIPEVYHKHPYLKEMYIEGNAFKAGANPIGIHKALEVSDSDFAA